MLHTMVDIETLGKTPDTVILTMAAQRFDPYGSGYDDEQSVNIRVTIESQENRTIDDSTVEWWATQSEEAKNDAFLPEGRVDLRTGLEQLHRLIWNTEMVWMNSPSFDAVILEHAWAQLGLPKPWQYWNLRDVRTLVSLVPELNLPKTSHTALADSRRQILIVQDALAYLKVRALK